MEFELDKKPIEKLLLDPNNYRFFDLPTWKIRQNTRFHDEGVQEATLRLMENTARYNLTELRSSIMANGYVALERIVVTPYSHADEYYLVIEGNRRIAALKALLRDNSEGVITLTPTQTEEFSNIPVAILSSGDELLSNQRIIMGIRHIAGPQEWGAYQQAYLIRQLVDDEGQSFDNIAQHMGLSPNETRRRYRAIKALASMQNDEMYSPAAKPHHYRLFHELVSIPNVRQFFSWDHDEVIFTDTDRARLFFELIAPLESERPAKIHTYFEVRNLRDIIGKPVAVSLLLDPDRTLAEAIAITKPEPAPQDPAELVDVANQFLSAIDQAQIDTIASLSQDDIQLLEEISNRILSRIDQYNKLTG